MGIRSCFIQGKCLDQFCARSFEEELEKEHGEIGDLAISHNYIPTVSIIMYTYKHL